MGSTSHGFPYPVGSDPVAQGDDAIKALAESVDTYVSTMPRAKITATADQSLTSAVTTAVTLGSVVYDNAAMADTANSRLVIKRAGYYRVTGRCVWASNATGHRILLINSASFYVADDYRMAAPGTITVTHVTSDPVYCPLNEQIVLRAVQNSGVAVSLSTANGRYSYLAASWIGY
jgi:hypothetical protein